MEAEPSCSSWECMLLNSLQGETVSWVTGPRCRAARGTSLLNLWNGGPTGYKSRAYQAPIPWAAAAKAWMDTDLCTSSFKEGAGDLEQATRVQWERCLPAYLVSRHDCTQPLCVCQIRNLTLKQQLSNYAHGLLFRKRLGDWRFCLFPLQWSVLGQVLARQLATAPLFAVVLWT